jgi:hypothetical protein
MLFATKKSEKSAGRSRSLNGSSKRLASEAPPSAPPNHLQLGRIKFARTPLAPGTARNATAASSAVVRHGSQPEGLDWLATPFFAAHSA